MVSRGEFLAGALPGPVARTMPDSRPRGVLIESHTPETARTKIRGLNVRKLYGFATSPA